MTSHPVERYWGTSQIPPSLQPHVHSTGAPGAGAERDVSFRWGSLEQACAVSGGRGSAGVLRCQDVGGKWTLTCWYLRVRYRAGSQALIRAQVEAPLKLVSLAFWSPSRSLQVSRGFPALLRVPTALYLGIVSTTYLLPREVQYCFLASLIEAWINAN